MQAFSILLHVFESTWRLGVEMAPYLWLGFAAAGILHVFWPVETIVRHLGGNSTKAVFKASILGIPLPLCSCGVLPVAAQLRKSGAGAAPTLSFLITTPVTGADSLLATWAFLGGIFTFIRLAVSFVLGMVVGLLCALFLPDTPRLSLNTESPSDGHAHTCDLACGMEKPSPRASFAVRLRQAAAYGFWELPESMASSVLLGLLIGGVITAAIPAETIADTVGTGIGGVIAAVLVAIPLYVCATGSIPIAAAMMLKGFSPGAALAFLIAGPASNTVAITTVRKLLGNRHLALYLTVIFLGSLGAGILFDAALSIFGPLGPLPVHASHGVHAGVPWWSTASGAALFGVMGIALFRSTAARILPHKEIAMSNNNINKKNNNNNIIRLSVPDMNCGHCKATISKLLSTEPGISSVDIHLENRTVEIRHDESLALQSILEKLANAGYPSRIVSP